MKSVREACTLRPEVLKGELEDAIFAADFGHVIRGDAREVYQNPSLFFRNTHPAAQLTKIVATVFGRLADPHEAGAVVRLSTGFGGGKTHTLIALWHLARNISDASLGTELLPAAGRPAKVAVAGFDGEKAGSSVVAAHEGAETHSLWGELAWQLGGAQGYALMQSVDRPESAPHSDLIRAILPPDKPVLILLDEVVKYMVQLTEQGRGCLLRFIGALASEIGARKQAVLVVSDPAAQSAYQKESSSLAQELADMEIARRLDDELGRKFSDTDPIGQEAAQVIARRLFEKIDRAAADEASAEYYNAYQRMTAEHPDLLPPEAGNKSYAARIVQCYPFHPRLLDVAQNKLGALEQFQKSRGTLRLFARILRRIWDGELDLGLISEGDLDWGSPSIQADLLNRLHRDRLAPAVEADVKGHAGRLDEDFSTDIHRRVAAALLLESLQDPSRLAADRRELALAVLRPSDVGHEPGEAMDRLMGICWHTYCDSTHQRFHFSYDANINKLIEERTSGVEMEDARLSVRTLAQGYFAGSVFSLRAWPSSPSAVPESAALKLVLHDSEKRAQAVCDYQDDSDPEAKQPRPFRNAIFAVAPTADGMAAAAHAMRLLLAAEAVKDEHKTNRAVKSQVEALLPTLTKRARLRTIRAYNRVIRQGQPPVTLPEQYLVADENALESVNGQFRLKSFLDDRKWIYQPTDVLDVDLLMDSLVKGATPSLDHPGAFLASAVHERALVNDQLRLMHSPDPVRGAVLEAVQEGKLVVRLANGEVYDAQGCVSGAPGARKRTDGKKLSGLQFQADVLLAPADAPCVAAWVREDTPAGQQPRLTFAEAAQPKGTTPDVVAEAVSTGKIDGLVCDGATVVLNNYRFQQWNPAAREVDSGAAAFGWEDAAKQAARRPLRTLVLRATRPEGAKQLLSVAQPFSAKEIKLSVQVSGSLKEGGMVNFQAKSLKHNHALKPIEVAAQMARAMAEVDLFEARLDLDFGEGGAKDTAARFEQAEQQADDGVKVEAAFGLEGE